MDDSERDVSELARRYGARLRTHCGQFLREPSRVDAVCEQVFLDAAAELADCGATHRFHDWLRRIADRRCHESVEARVLSFLDGGDRRTAEHELFEAYATHILGYCSRVLRDSRLAEDVAQQALLEACRDLERFRRQGSLFAWMRKIARNRCIDAIRHENVEARFESDEHTRLEEIDASSPYEVLDRSRQYLAVLECIGRLTPKNRHAVVVRFADDEASYTELAAILGENSDTLNRRVTRSMKHLRDCLATKGYR